MHGGLELNRMLSHFGVQFFSWIPCGMVVFDGVEASAELRAGRVDGRCNTPTNTTRLRLSLHPWQAINRAPRRVHLNLATQRCADPEKYGAEKEAN
jgi:hypothetical protein